MPAAIFLVTALTAAFVGAAPLFALEAGPDNPRRHYWLRSTTGPGREIGEMDPRIREIADAFGAGRYDECRRLAQALLEATDDADLREQAGSFTIESHLAEGEFEAARAAAELLNDGDALARINRIEAEYKAEVGRLQHIVATTEEPAEAARAQFLTARAHQRVGRLEPAQQSYWELITKYPDSLEAERAVSEILNMHQVFGTIESMSAVCDSVVGLDPDGPLAEAAIIEFGEFRGSTAIRARRIAHLEELARDQEGTQAEAYAVLAVGRLHVASMELRAAERIWAAFLADPAHRTMLGSAALEDGLSELRVELARAAKEEGRAAEALRLLELALSNPRWPLVCWDGALALAEEYEDAERYNDAVRAWQRLQAHESDATARLQLRYREADALRRGGRAREARSLYEEVMKAATGDESLRAACLAGLALSKEGRTPTR